MPDPLIDRPAVSRAMLAGSLDQLLQPAQFKDYGPNGLQVEGRDGIRKLVSGVTASRALIDAAIDVGDSLPEALAKCDSVIDFTSHHFCDELLGESEQQPAEKRAFDAANAAEGSGQLMPFIVYTLTNVVLSNVSVSGGTGGKPVETVSLNFTKIKWELTAQKDDGTKEGTAASTWDLAANKVVK